MKNYMMPVSRLKRARMMMNSYVTIASGEFWTLETIPLHDTLLHVEVKIASIPAATAT